MKPSSGSNSLPTNPPGNGYGQSPSGGATVPLKVYRELAAELQATKAMLDSLHNQNQHLAQQNQVVRQEVDRMVQSALTLQQALMSGNSLSTIPLQNLPPETARSQAEALAAQIRPHRAPAPPPPSSAYLPETDDANNPLLTSQPLPLLTKPEPSANEISGVWLWLIVISIIVTAFAAGFLVVKPLLPTNR